MKTIRTICWSIFLILLAGLSQPATTSASDLSRYKKILFAGYDWRIKKKSLPAGPGPNYFSAEPANVWVDHNGLHLTIKKQNGCWYCTQVILAGSFGYGTYLFTHGQVDRLDPNIVFGLFTWEAAAETVHYREMDIEFTRWGDPKATMNAQFTVQPSKHAYRQCAKNCSHLKVECKCQWLTNYLIWQPGLAEFRTYYGRYTDLTPPADTLIHRWQKVGEKVPRPKKETVRINFWLFRGLPPLAGQNSEIVINNFAFYPKAGD